MVNIVALAAWATPAFTIRLAASRAARPAPFRAKHSTLFRGTSTKPNVDLSQSLPLVVGMQHKNVSCEHTMSTVNHTWVIGPNGCPGGPLGRLARATPNFSLAASTVARWLPSPSPPPPHMTSQMVAMEQTFPSDRGQSGQCGRPALLQRLSGRFMQTTAAVTVTVCARGLKGRLRQKSATSKPLLTSPLLRPKSVTMTAATPLILFLRLQAMGHGQWVASGARTLCPCAIVIWVPAVVQKKVGQPRHTASEVSSQLPAVERPALRTQHARLPSRLAARSALRTLHSHGAAVNAAMAARK